MKILLSLFASLLFISSYCQSAATSKPAKTAPLHIEKNYTEIIDSTDIYANDGDSKALFYSAVVPKNKIKGTLILLPSAGESVESVFNNNQTLIQLACDSNLLIVVPSINLNICLDDISVNFLNTAFTDFLKKYNAPKDKIIIAGFSLGGTNAIRYTELAYEIDTNVAILPIIKPIAVYGVDPPLDWMSTYSTFDRIISRNFSPPAVGEAKYFRKRMHSLFGGSPEENPNAYIRYSAYSRNLRDGGNAVYLINIPIRIYSDPDIDWHMKNKHDDYYDMNALDQTAMINQLIILGNNKAEFINALGKGYRDGQRHPHSWSIVDPGECLKWILNCMK